MIIPSEINTILETIRKSGYEAYLVGGCVRDIFLGRKPKDWDITTNAKPEQIQKLFTKTVYENVYGTVAAINEETLDDTLRQVEITPYRLESTYSDNRHPDHVIFSEKIEDDLKRRDFTINSLALNVTEDTIKDTIDLFGGLKDIKDKIIRTVGNPDDRFKEDSLRMMRAIRLSVELGFKIDQHTLESIQFLNQSIKLIAIERIRDEFVKIIMSDNPKMGIELLYSTGLLKQIIPELVTTIGVTQNQAHSYDVWQHLLFSLQHAADKKWPLEIRLSALFHDISKPQKKGLSRETGIITFYGHELAGSRETQKILERMKFSRVTIDKIVKLVRWHMFFSDTETITLSAVRRMIVNVGRENIWDLMNLRVCDRVGTGRPKENPYRLRKYKSMIEEALRDPISVSMLKIDGNTLMSEFNLKPGPIIGNILNALLEEVLDDPKLNNEEYLFSRVKQLISLPEEELMRLAEKGREKKTEVEESEIKDIRNKHHVK